MAVSETNMQLHSRGHMTGAGSTIARDYCRQSMSHLLGAQYHPERVDHYLERLGVQLEPDYCPLKARYHPQTPKIAQVKKPSSGESSGKTSPRVIYTYLDNAIAYAKGEISFAKYLWNEFKNSETILRAREWYLERPWKHITGPIADLAHISIRRCIIQEAPQHEGLCKEDIEIIRIYPSGCLALTWIYCKDGLREDEIGCKLPFPAPTFKVGHSGNRKGNMWWFVGRFWVDDPDRGPRRKFYSIRVGIAEETIDEWNAIRKLAEDTKFECIWEGTERDE